MREALRVRQSALLQALVEGAEAPPGYDAARVRLCARGLANKRLREAAHSWPGLAPLVEEHFARYTASQRRPPGASPVVDGYRFARWLHGQGVGDDGLGWVIFHLVERAEGIFPRVAPGVAWNEGTLWLRLGSWRYRVTLWRRPGVGRAPALC